VLVPLALLLLVVVAVAVLAGVRHVIGDGAVLAALPAAAAVGGVVVVLAVVVTVGLARNGEPDPEQAPDEPPAVAAPTGAAPLRPTTLELVAVGEDRLPPVPTAVGALVDGGTMVVRVVGLEPGSRATVHQCPAGSVRAAACRPGLPFTVGDDQRATVLVDLEDRFEGGGDVVDCARTDCSVVVFGTSRLEVLTIFGRPAPPAVTVEVDPNALAPGGTLAAAAEHLPPGAEASFAVCRPGGHTSADCAEPTPAVTVGADGRAAAPVTVRAGRCPRGARCAIAVIVEGGGPRAYAPLRLIGRGGVAYEDARLAAGLGAAGLFLLIALVLVRRTDWTPVEGDPFAGVTIPEDPFADAGER
jgi:hypothetical protein